MDPKNKFVIYGGMFALGVAVVTYDAPHITHETPTAPTVLSRPAAVTTATATTFNVRGLLT
jgi:hypothetical protein